MNLHFAKYLDRYVGIVLCYTLAAIHLFREMISPQEGTVEVRRILMVKLWGFGNIVLLLPIIAMVRRRFPDARIDFLTLKRNRKLLEDHPGLDGVYCIDETTTVRLGTTLFRAVSRARHQQYDLFLDFEQFARISTLIGFIIGAKQRVGLGTPRQGRYLLYTAPVRYHEDQHMSRTFLDIARAGGVREEVYVPEPVRYGPEEAAAVDALVGGREGPLVAVHAGSGDNFIGRRWPAGSFARLLDRLVREKGAVPVFTGTPSEAPLVKEVLDAMEEAPRALNICGHLDLAGLAALLDRVEFLLANDTGPVHMASSLGTPVLGFYGPNTPDLYGPLSPGSVPFYKSLACSPCITNLNYKTSFCRLPVCILNITVDEVYEQAARLLDGAPRRLPAREAS